MTSTEPHQPGKGAERVERGVDPANVQLVRQNDLPFGDVAGQVRNGMRDVLAGHRQHRDLGERSLTAIDPAGAFVEAGQIAVEITGIAAPARYLAARGGDLAHGVGVARHVGHHNEDMATTLEGQMLGDCESEPRRRDPLDERIVCGVEEKYERFRSRRLLEPFAHRGGVGMRNPHRGENDCERFVLHGRLGRDLGCELEMREAAD